MKLSQVNPGDTIEIIGLPDPVVRAQAIRLGIYEGAVIKCSERINKGPVILQNRLQEIAIGFSLSEKIEVCLYTQKTLEGTRDIPNVKKGSRFSFGYER